MAIGGVATIGVYVLAYEVSRLSSLVESRMDDVILPDMDETPATQEYEEERREYFKQFDARIERLKNEVAEEQQLYSRRGSVADELHPLVKNIPHDSVRAVNSLPDEEYAR